MRKQVLIFGLVGGVLITLLQWTEFHFIVLEHSVAIYGVLIAILFAGAGVWFGTRLLAPRERIVEIAVPSAPKPNFTADDKARDRGGVAAGGGSGRASGRGLSQPAHSLRGAFRRLWAQRLGSVWFWCGGRRCEADVRVGGPGEPWV